MNHNAATRPPSGTYDASARGSTRRKWPTALAALTNRDHLKLNAKSALAQNEIGAAESGACLEVASVADRLAPISQFWGAVGLIEDRGHRQADGRLTLGRLGQRSLGCRGGQLA